MGSHTPLLPQSASPPSPSTASSPPSSSHKSRRPLHFLLRLLLLSTTISIALVGLSYLVDAGATAEAARRLGEKASEHGRKALGRIKELGGGTGHEYIVTPKLRIMHLVDFETSELLMDRWLLHSHHGFASRPDLVSQAVLWGPGFPFYTSTSSLSENIRQRYGSADHFDAVLVYFNNDQMKHLGIDPMPWFKEVEELSRQGRGVVIIDRPHEMRDQRRVPMYEHANVTLVLSPYPSELLQYRQFENRTLLVHQPHFIDPHIFFHPVDQPRPQDIIIAGDLGAFYPFRRRLADMILAHKLSGWIRGHPGYADIKAPEQRPTTINAEHQEQQLVDFGNDLSNAKICIVTSSRWQYSVQKYSEAAAAGCLIMGNVPLDRSYTFSQHMVPISNTLSDDAITSLASYWLSPSHEEERLERARGMQEWVVREFGLGKYVEQVVRAVWAVQSGQRGMVLPWEWHEEPAVWPVDG